MKIDSVTAQYMKLQPNITEKINPDTKLADTNVSNKERSDKTLKPDTKIERGSISSSNKKLNELLNSEEKKTIAKLFGMDGMAKLNQILDTNDGRVSELPRGILVNIKV
ncbi:MAG: hypothetical protein IIB94_00205 [Candidatus Marinimicrobia bacterium]|nr:hypothetical protein [Candidatus Neomarinimicrobiota bacterium]